MNDIPHSAAFGARQLRLWLATLSPGDLSVNEAAAARPGSRIATGVGSANDVLWSQMEHPGWAQRITSDELSVPGVTSVYALTTTGAGAVTTEIAAIVAVKNQILGKLGGFDPHAAPERVRQLCAIFSSVVLRAMCQLALAKEAKPTTEEGQNRQSACILALDEIFRGGSTAGLFIAEAVARGPDSTVGLELLERATAGLRYAEQCLTQWAAEMRAEQFRGS